MIQVSGVPSNVVAEAISKSLTASALARGDMATHIETPYVIYVRRQRERQNVG